MVQFEITFARHGESVFNKGKLVQGQTDSPLSEEGELQAQYLAKRMSNEVFDYVFVSDLTRAQQTAEAILKSLTTPPREIIKEVKLRERHFGDREGMHISDYRVWLQERGLNFRNHEPEGGESFPVARERIVNAFNDICEKLLVEEGAVENSSLLHVLVVGHGLLYKELYCHFIDTLCTDIPGGKERVKQDSANTSVSRFLVDYSGKAPPVVKCQFLYDYSHLPEEMQKALPSKAY
ncbi:fructose-2,6-bisphosphatase TIGAR-like [Diadema antillarum]|uniref:fructose-2,6-bisphosphatase TIGAR-like n=1 Tax=Diadema antillarum TaxID=105358 RepID=UPI003A8967B8